jgi:hypothetical protein
MGLDIARWGAVADMWVGKNGEHLDRLHEC